MIDPLNISLDLTNVETTLPILPDGDYRFQIAESAIVPNKDATGYNWKLKLGLADPATAVDGRPVAPNFPVFHTMALQAREDSNDKEAFKRSIGEAIDAIYGTDKSNRPNFNAQLVQDVVGKTVKATIAIDTYQGNQNNKVRRLKKDA